MMYYEIDGDNNRYPTLRAAKWHCEVAYTPNERKRYLNGCNICKIVKEELRTITPIYVGDNGVLSFGRTFKY